MTPKFGKIFLISVLTTLVGLISCLVSLSNNSAYFGLFIIGISPLHIYIYFIWTVLLTRAPKLENIFRKVIIVFPLTMIFEYFIVLIMMLLLSGDSRSYDLSQFLHDSADVICDKKVFFCILIISVFYSCFLSLVTKSKKIIKDVTGTEKNEIEDKKGIPFNIIFIVSFIIFIIIGSIVHSYFK